jgi:hypothetical protein
MMRLFGGLLLITALAAFQYSTQDWDRADAATVRLTPADIPALPAAIRAELERRKCTIPQAYQQFREARPGNAITGRFLSATSRDWAVLCSRNRSSTILVFRGASAVVAAELATDEDKGFLQTLAAGAIGFSRSLTPVSPPEIRRHHDPAIHVPLPVLDHDGIDDAFVGKGSRVFYWDARRWLELPGSDAPVVHASRR